jgi:hypothetical protein
MRKRVRARIAERNGHFEILNVTLFFLSDFNVIYFFDKRNMSQELVTWLFDKKKGKVVPLHAMEALGGRGGIAPALS